MYSSYLGVSDPRTLFSQSVSSSATVMICACYCGLISVLEALFHHIIQCFFLFEQNLLNLGTYIVSQLLHVQVYAHTKLYRVSAGYSVPFEFLTSQIDLEIK